MPGVACKGTTLGHGATPSLVAELLSLNLPEQGAIVEEDTDLDDDAERFSSTGVSQAGEVTGEILMSPATHAALIALQDSHEKTPWELTYPGGAKHTFTGATFRMGIAIQLKSFFRASFTIPLDGKLTFVPAAP